MYLQHFMIDVGSQEVNSYLMADEKTGIALLVDAGGFDPLIVETAVELDLRLTHILITHLHWDHIDALPQFLEQWPHAEVIAPAPLDAASLARLVREGDSFQVGSFTFEVLKTSGHTPESVSYYCPSAGLCFVGDAIFAGSVGGTSSDEMHREEVDNIFKKIMTLPEQTEILSGHGPLTTVAIEKRANPFLQPGFGRG